MLSECEYYLFIDFKREKLITDNSDGVYHRGSLFSNQELAVAIYLDKPIISFQEKGVKIRDGMLSAIQANVITFDKRGGLVDRIIEKIKAKWVNNWRNEVVFHDQKRKSITPEYLGAYGQSGFSAIFFHINVINLHRDTSAQNCVAYLESYSILDKKI
jgi:hypothetical protein